MWAALVPISPFRVDGVAYDLELAGHMAVSASGKGGLLLRVDPARTEELLADGRAGRFVMRGR